RLVGGYYDAFLGRAPDPTGLAAWVGELQGGRLTPAQVAQAFLASDEFHDLSPRQTDPGGESPALLADGEPDIEKVSYSLPTEIDPRKSFVHGGLMFVSTSAFWTQPQAGRTVFGTAETPATVLIGLRQEGGRFTPMLLTHGVTELFLEPGKG